MIIIYVSWGGLQSFMLCETASCFLCYNEMDHVSFRYFVRQILFIALIPKSDSLSQGARYTQTLEGVDCLPRGVHLSHFRDLDSFLFVVLPLRSWFPFRGASTVELLIPLSRCSPLKGLDSVIEVPLPSRSRFSSLSTFALKSLLLHWVSFLFEVLIPSMKPPFVFVRTLP